MADYVEWIELTQDTLLEIERQELPLALKGDYGAVRRLLRILAAAINQSVPLTPLLANYLVDALRAISDGGDPKAAFRIKRKRGSRDTTKGYQRAINWVWRIKVLRNQQPTLSIEKAIGKVADEESVPDETIKAAWRDHRSSVYLMPDGTSAFVEFRESR